ncbi:MAG: DUF11 domain-containing protein [Holophagales bacterium]|nr:MAG: DUF11 domain-containing protein [Holophagales bacterium]
MNRPSPRRSVSYLTLAIPIALALALLGGASVQGQILPNEEPIASAQPEQSLMENPNPLGRIEKPEPSRWRLPEVAIACAGGGGPWSSASTWSPSSVPTSADSVTVTSGCSVTIDSAASALSVTVQSGGLLEFDSTTARTLTVAQTVTIDVGGTFQTASTGAITSHQLSIGGDLVNNGTLDFSTNGNTAGAGIAFTGAGNSTFGGAGATTDIRALTINKGTSFANILELNPSTFSVQGTTSDGAPMAFLTLTNGTFKVSGTFTLAGRVFTATAYTIPTTGGIWLNNPNFTVSGQTASPTNNGLLRLSNGTYNVGTASGNSMGAGTGAFFIIEGGTLNVAGRLNSGNTFITYTQSGGTVNVSTVGNAATTPSFGFTGGTGVVTNFSGGAINLVQASTNGTPVDYNQSGTMNFTGGTLNVGTGATTTNFVFRIQGQMPNVVINNTTNNKTASLSNQANVWGNLTVNPGTTLNLANTAPVSANTLLMIGPSLINNGAIVVNTNNTGTVNFAAGLQQVGVPYAQTYLGSGTFGTAAVRVGAFSVQSPLGVTLDPGVSNLNIYRINAFYGVVTNSAKLANGAGDTVALVIQRGATGIAFAAGGLDVAPTFNIGSGGLTLVYAQSAAMMTTGPEVPVSRSILSFQLSNPTGVTVSGGALTCTGATNCLLLQGGTLNTDATNLFTVGNTTAAALSGGSALTYVNGPLARTLPASLAAAATYTFPVGKSSFKMLELVNPTTNAGGTAVVQVEVFDANPGGTAGTGFTSINTNRYWSATLTAGAANFTNATVRLTEQGTPAVNAIGQSATLAGAYNSIGGAVTAPTIGPSTTTVTALDFFVVGTLTGSSTLCGNFTVGSGGAYPTLTAAVAALNSSLMTCAVTFTLTDNTYAAETYPIQINPNGGASAANTLTIKPGVGATPTFVGSATTALIILNGADYVTIDGSNSVGGSSRNMSLQNTNTGTSSAVIWGQTVGTNDPATNNTIKNLNIAGNAPTTTLVGIGFGSSTIGSASLGSRNDNNRVQNNAITSLQFGVYSQGASSATKNVGTVITGNTLGGAGALALGRAGIYVGFDDGVQVTNNTVNGVTSSLSSSDVFGIALGTIAISNSAFSTNDDVANAVVTGNIVGSVTQTATYSAAGISLGTNNYGTSLIANNSVYGVVSNGTTGDFCVGIYVGNAGTAYATTQVYYNSVSMVGNRDTGGATNQPAFALAVLGANPKVDIRNNALYNISTAGTGGAGGNAGSYAIGLSSTAPFNNITSNYNDLFTSGGSSHFAMAGSLSSIVVDVATLAAWQSTVGKDANSISVDPLFNSSTVLQPQLGSPLLNAGTPVAVTIDITGATRSVTAPTLGAYEAAADTAPPVITYATLGNTTSTANRLLSILVTDSSGVPTAGAGLPVLYFRKGLSGAYSASQCAFVSGSSYDCTFNYALIGGVVTGDTVQYYVAAQDTPANVTTNPLTGAAGFTASPPAAATPPTTPNSYLIAVALTGNKTVCASGCDFTTLTGATGIFNAINTNVATGNITIEIGGDLIVGEDGSVALNALAEEPVGSNFTVKIYPVGAPRAITSTTAPTGGFIRLNGADRVTLDGSIGGTGTDRSLTITESNTGSTSAVIWLQSNGSDGATNNTIKNLNVVGNSNTTTAIGIGSGGSTVGTSSLGTGNNSNTIQNNSISKVQYGIYSQGASAAAKNTGTVITQNVMTTVSPDNVSKGGIWLGFEDGVQVTRNAIDGITQSSSPDVFGIALGLSSISTTSFTGNEVTNATVTKNVIGKVTNTGTFSAVGISLVSATSGTSLIANNFIYGVGANGTSGDFGAGIFLGGGAGSTTRVYANSVSMTGTLTGGSYPNYGLAIGGTDPVVDVRDNVFYNTMANGTGVSFAIGTASSTYANLTSNYNDLFVTAGGGTFKVGKVGSLSQGSGTELTALGDWQTTTGKDANSLTVDPLFTSPTDLHLQLTSPMLQAGTALASVTDDIDGDPRPASAPDIGADEIVQNADLSITKTDGVTSVVQGGTATYTITASNAGPSAASGSLVTDTFPAACTSVNWTCTPSGGATCTASGSGNISDTVNIPVGDSVVYTAACAVSPSATGSLANTATVAAPAGITDPTPGNNSATDTDSIVVLADLSITKTDGVTSATPGGSVTYTITVGNAGPIAEPAAAVADTFPVACTSVSYTSAAAGGATGNTAAGAGNIADTLNLPVGASVTYTATCNISGSASGSLSNTATVTGSLSDPNLSDNSATDIDGLGAVADVSITKTDGSATEVPGTPVTYTITATNAGPSPAPSVTIADTFAGTLSGCSTTCIGSGGATCTAGPVSGNLNDSANLPSGGSVTYTATCNIASSASGTLVNTATATVGGSVTDPNPGNNTATDTDTLNGSADVSITKTDGSATEVPGTPVTYTIVASNAGPSAASSVTVADTFAGTLSGCSTTCIGSGGATCAAGPVSGNLNDTANLPVGGSATYTATCNIASNATGTLANTATATVGGGATDPTPGNNSATDTDTLNASADVSITKTDGSASEVPGTPVTYTITVSNAGPSAASSVTVADTFAATLSGCSTTCVASGGASCAAGPVSGNLNDAASVPVGGSAVYTATCNIAANATGTLANTATATVGGGATDPTPGNNSATDTDTLGASANLGITKTDGVTTATAGGSVTYTIVASNAGPSNAPSSVVTDTFPSSLTCSTTCSGSGGGTCTAGPFSTNINDTVNLPSGASVTYTSVCTVAVNATGSIRNTATVATGSGVTDPTPSNNSATDEDVIPGTALFSDGFETGNTSRWGGAQTLFHAYQVLSVSGSTIEAGYDLAGLPGFAFESSAIAEVAGEGGQAMFRLVARRTDANAAVELSLEVVGGGSSAWVAASGSQLRFDWTAGSAGHVALAIDGRLALWVDGFATSATPATLELRRSE